MTAKPQLIRRKTHQRESACRTPSAVGTLGVNGSEKATGTLTKWTCARTFGHGQTVSGCSASQVCWSRLWFSHQAALIHFLYLSIAAVAVVVVLQEVALEDLPDKLSPRHSTDAPSHNTSERVHLLLDQVFQIALLHTSYWHGKSYNERACMLGGGTDYSFTSKWNSCTIVLLPNDIAVL